MTQFVALLRGINVGGKGKVSMAELKACFEKLGFKGVRTYINSGNVLFESPKKDAAKLNILIDKALAETFECKPPAVILTRAHLQAIVAKAPPGFGTDAAYRFNVLFLKSPVTVQEAEPFVSVKSGVDTVMSGDGVFYFQIFIAKASQSKIRLLAGTRVYKSMTIRNWNTTTKLLALLDN